MFNSCLSWLKYRDTDSATGKTRLGTISFKLVSPSHGWALREANDSAGHSPSSVTSLQTSIVSSLIGKIIISFNFFKCSDGNTGPLGSSHNLADARHWSHALFHGVYDLSGLKHLYQSIRHNWRCQKYCKCWEYGPLLHLHGMSMTDKHKPRWFKQYAGDKDVCGMRWCWSVLRAGRLSSSGPSSLTWPRSSLPAWMTTPRPMMLLMPLRLSQWSSMSMVATPDTSASMLPRSPTCLDSSPGAPWLTFRVHFVNEVLQWQCVLFCLPEVG